MSTARLLRNLILKIGVVAAVVCILLFLIFSVRIQYGNNMHPAVRDGDLVVGFRLQKPYLNAAVIYSHDGRKNVGRVVALAGSDVEVTEQGELKVDGGVPPEEVFYPTYPSDKASIAYPYHVDNGKVFILNDFREDRSDSREFGAVDLSEVDGPLIFSMRRRGF